MGKNQHRYIQCLNAHISTFLQLRKRFRGMFYGINVHGEYNPHYKGSIFHLKNYKQSNFYLNREGNYENTLNHNNISIYYLLKRNHPYMICMYANWSMFNKVKHCNFSRYYWNLNIFHHCIQFCISFILLHMLNFNIFWHIVNDYCLRNNSHYI